MTSKYSARGKLFAKWNQMYLKATDVDRWNQFNSAIEQYEKFSSIIEDDIEAQKFIFSPNQLKLLNNVCACFRLRSKTLQNMAEYNITLTDMERLRPLMKNLSGWRGPFPLSFQTDIGSESKSSTSNSPQSWRSTSTNEVNDLQLLQSGLPPRLPARPGYRRLAIKINSIGLKDASLLMQPCIVVSIKDNVGIPIETDQIVSLPIKTEPTCLHFNQAIEIQRYIEKFYKGTAIFFEIKRCKNDKSRLLSTKCYSFIEPDLIKPGPTSLRLLKKPIDYSRRRMIFLTKKPLYLNAYCYTSCCYLDITVTLLDQYSSYYSVSTNAQQQLEMITCLKPNSCAGAKING
eukprot:gene20640-22675_t